MAGWISSKLKVAESLLHQIDQQAADSLGKNDKPHTDEFDIGTTSKSGGSVSLKDQLKKKAPEINSDFIGKSKCDYSPDYYTARKSFTSDSGAKKKKNQENAIFKADSKSTTLTDHDWTELLSTPKPSSSSKPNRANGASSGVLGLKKDVRKVGNLGLDVKGNIKVGSSLRKAGDGAGGKANGRLGDRKRNEEDEVRESDSTPRGSSAGCDDKSSEVKGLVQQPVVVDTTVRTKEVDEARNSSRDTAGNGPNVAPGEQSTDTTLQIRNYKPLVNVGSTVSVASEVLSKNDQTETHNERMRSSLQRVEKAEATTVNYALGDPKQASYLESDEESGSESESGSTSGSEIEREREERRKRRQQILAEKAAAKAADAVKDRENLVARLEGEKQSLEKILEERAKQAAQEASELQSTMMDMMDAVEMEKQKHNNTRMEVLARLAKLETANAGLARSLATTQWDLEVKINRIAELRQEIELKEVAHEELRRRISRTHQSGTPQTKLVSRGIELEMHEAECSFVAHKVTRLQEKATKLEADIQLAQKEMENPTEVEAELKQRLRHMTDHLIQKQAQVEGLCSEKATLQFRIETASRLLDENKLMNGVDSSSTSVEDMEAGTWELSRSKLRPMFEEKIKSGKQHFGSLVVQLDALFLAGAVFLRRNPTAKIWSLIYVVCLHLWVLYILFSNSQSSDAVKSAAVVSLENINNTVGV